MPAVSSSLVSAQNYVESPFIIVEIGKYKFGHCSDMSHKNIMGTMNVVFPNFIQSLNIVKINGAVNTYTLRMDYAITQFDDPNMLDKVFSSVSKSRKLKLTYGDWNAPGFIYKEEEALITKVVSNVQFEQSKISYTVSCVSASMELSAGSFSFNARVAKPSDVLFELLTNESYGLSKTFTGMAGMNRAALSNLIARDDKPVQLEAKQSVSVLEYMGYLVGCMVSSDDPGGPLKKANYYWSVYDDTTNKYGGTYFKVVKVSPDVQYNVSYDTYELDVGYPSGNFVSSFSLKSDNTWAILYDYASDIKQPQYQYSIDKNGNVASSLSPSVTSSSTHLKTTETDRTWWTQMTQFPISGSVTIKGLLRPTILMSYVKLNVFFYGRKHVSSGLYIITKHEDTIDFNGYKTTLSITRLSGDTTIV